jgi:hypothetical protein
MSFLARQSIIPPPACTHGDVFSIHAASCCAASLQAGFGSLITRITCSSRRCYNIACISDESHFCQFMYRNKHAVNADACSSTVQTGLASRTAWKWMIAGICARLAHALHGSFVQNLKLQSATFKIALTRAKPTTPAYWKKQRRHRTLSRAAAQRKVVILEMSYVVWPSLCFGTGNYNKHQVCIAYDVVGWFIIFSVVTLWLH